MLIRLSSVAVTVDTTKVSGIHDGVLSRVRSSGVRAASTVDLVTVGFARREEDVDGGEQIARKFLTRYQHLHGLGEASPDEIASSTGLEGFEITRAMALIEIGRRVGNAGKGAITTIEHPRDVYELLIHLVPEKREHLVAILLDAKNQVLRVAPIHIGTLTASVVGPREIFREAIREGASSVIIAHNHPSGDPTPSVEDIHTTELLVKVGQMLDIPVVDHVIIGDRRTYSFNAHGLI